jgi:hypothetical protein
MLDKLYPESFFATILPITCTLLVNKGRLSMAHKILVINTGSSTTRVAIMQNNQCLAQEEKVHST